MANQNHKNTAYQYRQRLDRAQQLTLNTWRLAARKLERTLELMALPEHAAVHLVLGVLRDTHDPLALFARHAVAEPELRLVQSLVQDGTHADLDFDILDAGFLLRWNELVADGSGPEELPPLRRHDQR